MAPRPHLSLGALIPRKVRPIRNQKELHLSGCPGEQSGATGSPVLGPSACRPSFINRKVGRIALALAMWSHPPWPDFHGVFSSVIYLSEPPSPSELLAFFFIALLPSCKYAPIHLHSVGNTFFSIYSFSLLPTLPPGPITAKEINKKHNSFWLLFFFLLCTVIYIITRKQILLLK